MQSPFVDEVQSAAQEPDPELLEQLNKLIADGLKAKQEAERQKALYDAIRDQACAILRDIGEDAVQSEVGKVRLKETKSGWKFSSATNQLSDQLKIQQDLEKKNGIAKPAKTTLSADIFPV